MTVVAEREPLDTPGSRGRPRLDALRRRYRHMLHALGRQHVAPPSNTADEGQDGAHHAHREVSHQPSESERHAERDDHRPHGGSGKLEAVEAFRVCHGLSNASTASSSGRYNSVANKIRRADARDGVRTCARPIPSSPSPSTHAVAKYAVPLSPIAAGSTLTPRSASVDVTIWRSATVPCVSTTGRTRTPARA